MTRRRKTLLAAFVLVLAISIGGFAWYWHETTVDRQVNALMGEVRDMWVIEPTWFQRCLTRLGFKRQPSGGDAVEELVKLGPPAVPALIRALSDNDPLVRSVAAEALGELKDPRAVEPLILTLKDEYWRARRKAAWALAGIGDVRAVEPLIAALDDEDPEVPFDMAVALGLLGDSRAVEPLLALLADRESLYGRAGAALALGKLKEVRAVKPLVSLIIEDDDINGRCAREALIEIGNPAVEPLRQLVKENAAPSSLVEKLVQQIRAKATTRPPPQTQAATE